MELGVFFSPGKLGATGYRRDRELSIVMAGPKMSPSVVCLDTGDSVRLWPAHLRHDGIGASISYSDRSPPDAWWANAWVGDLPAPAGTSAKLLMVADGEHHRCTVTWEEPSAPRPSTERADTASALAPSRPSRPVEPAQEPKLKRPRRRR